MEAIEKERWDRVMSQKEVEVTRLTSVQLLDAAIWREIGTEEPQPAPAFLEALSALVGRWLIARSSEPEMDVVTVMCRARGYIERCGAEQSRMCGPRIGDRCETFKASADRGRFKIR